MTQITLHGILAKEFGSTFQMKLNRAKDVIAAINCNRKGFTNRINQLASEGLNYTIIVDGKQITQLEELSINSQPKIIHLVPIITGAFIALIITGIASVAAAIAPVIATVGSFLAANPWLVQIAIGVVSMGIQMLLAPKPEAPAPISASTRALQDSFSFSNKVNVASQGTPVPIGYGRLIVGSQIIQSTVKSYQQKTAATKIMKNQTSENEKSSVAVITNI